MGVKHTAVLPNGNSKTDKAGGDGKPPKPHVPQGSLGSASDLATGALEGLLPRSTFHFASPQPG